MVDLALTGFDTLGIEDRRRMRRVAFGVALSMLVHTALLTLWRSNGRPADLPAPMPPIAVRIQPQPPPRIETPEPQPATAAKAERPAPARKQRTPQAVIAVPPDTARSAEPAPFVVEPADTPPTPTDTPHFDLDAAKRSARSLAKLRDPAKVGTPVGQFPEKPLETETKAARLIGAAKRRDCKDGVPGGLLAPLLLLADKKDSGCKW